MLVRRRKFLGHVPDQNPHITKELTNVSGAVRLLKKGYPLFHWGEAAGVRDEDLDIFAGQTPGVDGGCLYEGLDRVPPGPIFDGGRAGVQEPTPGFGEGDRSIGPAKVG